MDVCFNSIGPGLRRGSALVGFSSLVLLSVATATAQTGPASSPAPAEIVDFDSARAAELDSYVESALGILGVPGAAIAVIQGGQIAHLHAFGVLSEGGSQPVDLDTRFMIGSLSKAMTAAMAATLVDEGRLDWDTPAVALIPDFQLSNAQYTPLVTIRDLMDHTSGVVRSDAQLFVKSFEPVGLIANVASFPVVAPPGQRYEYQNQMFTIGGFAAVRAAGYAYGNRSLETGYNSLMQSRVFDPTGMRRTTVSYERALREPNHAWPHTYDPVQNTVVGVPIGFERFSVPIAPAGAVWSSIRDMARYAVVQAREGLSPEGRRVVSAQQLGETQTAQVALADNLGYGFGWLVANEGGTKILSHDGGTAGFNSRILVLPDLDLAVVILTNRWGATAFLDAVLQYTTSLLLGQPAPDDSPALAEEEALRQQLSGLANLVVPVTYDSVRRFLGDYSDGISVRYREGTILIRTDFGEFPMQAVPGFDNAFLNAHNVGALLAASFSEDDRGQITLTIGIPDAESESLLQAVELAKRPRSCSIARGPNDAFRRIHQLFAGPGSLLPRFPHALDPHGPSQVGRFFQRRAVAPEK